MTSEADRDEQCIYCLQYKPPSAFNTEHVLHDSMGSFRNPLLLTSVCEKCNQRFGDTIDLAFGRDSPEGFGRYWDGLKSVSKAKPLGRKALTRIETADPRLRHLYMHPMPLPNVYGWAGAPAAQVEFRQGDLVIARLLDELPTLAEVQALGFRVGKGDEIEIRIFHDPPDAVMATLRAKGFQNIELGAQQSSLAGTFKGELVFTITHPQLRAIAKIGLNYVASQLGAGTARLPNFDRIRDYIRNDQVLDSGRVKVIPPLVPTSRAKQRDLSAHWVSLERVGQTVFARVCFFGRTCYEVRLSEMPFRVYFPMQAAHLYDLDAHLVSPIDPPMRFGDVG